MGRRAVKRQWRKEQALKGDREAFNCMEEVLNWMHIKGEEESLNSGGNALNCKEYVLN